MLIETFASTQKYKYFLFHNASKMLILRYFSRKHHTDPQLVTAA